MREIGQADTVGANQIAAHGIDPDVAGIKNGARQLYSTAGPASACAAMATAATQAAEAAGAADTGLSGGVTARAGPAARATVYEFCSAICALTTPGDQTTFAVAGADGHAPLGYDLESATAAAVWIFAQR